MKKNKFTLKIVFACFFALTIASCINNNTKKQQVESCGFEVTKEDQYYLKNISRSSNPAPSPIGSEDNPIIIDSNLKKNMTYKQLLTI